MTEAFRPESVCWRSDAAQGNFTVRLAERKLMVNAVDASSRMVELATRQAREAGYADHVSVSQADSHSLPFETGHFDLVVAVGVIAWLHSPAQAAAEVAACRHRGAVGAHGR